MELFSHRKGLKPIKSIIQIDSMDDDLRNGLWDALIFHFWDQMKTSNYGDIIFNNYNDVGFLIQVLWHGYFKKPKDTINRNWHSTLAGLRKFFFDCQWNEAYDFIEFIANKYPNGEV